MLKELKSSVLWAAETYLICIVQAVLAVPLLLYWLLWRSFSPLTVFNIKCFVWSVGLAYSLQVEAAEQCDG